MPSAGQHEAPDVTEVNDPEAPGGDGVCGEEPAKGEHPEDLGPTYLTRRDPTSRTASINTR
jgi:hypothetical protein